MANRLRSPAARAAFPPLPNFTPAEQQALLGHFEDRYLAAYGERYRRAPRRDGVDLDWLATRGDAAEVRAKIDLAFARPWDHDERVTLDVVYSGWDELDPEPAVGTSEWRDRVAFMRANGQTRLVAGGAS